MTAATVLAVGYALHLLLRWLRRSKPGLSVGAPVAAAFALRVGAAAAIGLIGIEELRGPDEVKFVNQAELIADGPLISGVWIEALVRDLHKLVLAAQLGALGSPDIALRITHIGISVAGIALLAAAAQELAGPRAAAVSAWLMALEPTSVFYSGVLHKEATLFLAVGLVALGGARLWRGRASGWLLPIVAGCAVAGATRYYVGLFLAVAAAAILMHGWIRRAPRGGRRALAVAVSTMLVVFVGIPAGWMLTTPQRLDRLSRLQASVERTSANLPLEPVDFSSREGVATGLPRRISDVLVRPYPWQLGSTKQRIGLFGTLVLLAALMWLATELIMARGKIMERAGPLIYIGLMLLIAYSLSAANAGTAFRHRTQLVSLGLCLAVVLLEQRARQRAEVRARHVPGRPALAGMSR